MSESEPIRIGSRQNVQFKLLRRLIQDNTAYRKEGRVWLEGDHLCRAALARGLAPELAVFSAASYPQVPHVWWQAADKVLIVEDELWRDLSTLESPAPMGFVLRLPPPTQVGAGDATVILDRLQDAGNVGSVLRSAAAFGFTQVLALKGTAALWSTKVLRAGMGAHFGLRLIEQATLSNVDQLSIPVLVTSSHRGQYLHQAELPHPCAWALGHEGQGVCEALELRARAHIRIIQPGGEESLNVAAAAAICLHASASLLAGRMA